MAVGVVCASPVQGQQKKKAGGLGSAAKAAPVPAAPAPDPQPVQPKPAATPEQAIAQGVDFLLKTQKPDGTWPSKYTSEYALATESLAVLAALSAGQTPDQPQIKLTIDYMARFAPTTVYARSVRAMVYARLDQTAYGKRLAEDVTWLLGQQRPNGGWGLGPTHKFTAVFPDWTDTLSSHLAVQALSDAVDAGATVPLAVWRKALGYWAATQYGAANDPNAGAWGYDPPGYKSGWSKSTGLYAAAGVSAVATLIDKLSAADPARLSAQDEAVLSKGLKWLADNYSATGIPNWDRGDSAEFHAQYLYYLAQAGRLCGVARFGDADWRRGVVEFLMGRQRPDGSWGPAAGGAESETPIRTAYAVLCLADCAGKPTISKLKLPDGNPVTDARDVANIARRLTAQGKQPARWQWLEPASPQAAYDASPVLYLSGRGKPAWPAPFEDRLQKYLASGGVVMAAPEGGDTEFASALAALIAKLSPRCQPQTLPANHPILTTPAPLGPDAAKSLTALGDAFRVQVLIVGGDAPAQWSAAKPPGDSVAMALAVNIAQFAMSTRTPSTAGGPSDDSFKPSSRVAVARIKHNGDWQVCPEALHRLSAALAASVSIAVKEAPAVDLSADVNPLKMPLLWMTGSETPGLTPAQRARLKRYLEGGGVLFADAAIGRGEFADGVAEMLKTMFGPQALEPLDVHNPILTGELAGGAGSDLSAVAYTTESADGGAAKTAPDLWCVRVGGRVAVVFSRYGVTSTLEGPPAAGARALMTDDARRLAANVVLYAISGD